MQQQCPFMLLGIRPGANKIEITKAWRGQMLATHPDHHGGDAALARAQLLNDAKDRALARVECTYESQLSMMIAQRQQAEADHRFMLQKIERDRLEQVRKKEESKALKLRVAAQKKQATREAAQAKKDTEAALKKAKEEVYAENQRVQALKVKKEKEEAELKAKKDAEQKAKKEQDERDELKAKKDLRPGKIINLGGG